MKINEYIRAIHATRNRNTLNRIIYYCGYDKDLEEGETKAIIAAADVRLEEINRERLIDYYRRNSRDIRKIQA